MCKSRIFLGVQAGLIFSSFLYGQIDQSNEMTNKIPLRNFLELKNIPFLIIVQIICYAHLMYPNKTSSDPFFHVLLTLQNTKEVSIFFSEDT